jgi:hypothetical protein
MTGQAGDGKMFFFVTEKEAKMACCSHFSSDASQKHSEMKKNTREPPEHTLSFSPMQSFT